VAFSESCFKNVIFGRDEGVKDRNGEFATSSIQMERQFFFNSHKYKGKLHKPLL
jgi:hypothetical protein